MPSNTIIMNNENDSHNMDAMTIKTNNQHEGINITKSYRFYYRDRIRCISQWSCMNLSLKCQHYKYIRVHREYHSFSFIQEKS